MAAENTNIADKTLDRADAGTRATTKAILANASLKDCRDASKAMSPLCSAELNHLTIQSSPSADQSTSASSKPLADALTRLSQQSQMADESLNGKSSVADVRDISLSADSSRTNTAKVEHSKSRGDIPRVPDTVKHDTQDKHGTQDKHDTQNKHGAQDKHDAKDKNGVQDKHYEASDKNKLHGTPEQLNHLDASRERLKKDVAQNIENPQDREKFTKDMEAFEQRAKSQPLSAREVSETYDQLSKLLEAKNAAVPKKDRVLAAETFAHHMADPTNIDQGNHGTCNMTALEERLITRNPSKAAEIVATMGVTGQWKAPDGKIIKIPPASLVPGAEERDNPPADGQRSYATQLMNLALINDAEQRLHPPMFYSQETPKSKDDTGERLRYADGRDVLHDDLRHDGDKTPYNGPSVQRSEVDRVGQSITGETKFVISNDKEDRDKGVVLVHSPEDLRRTLAEMKAQHKLPAIIEVDSNSQAFGGDPSSGPGWHVVSVTDYDEKTGKVHISNQWGKDSDKDMTLEELYKSTYTHPKVKEKQEKPEEWIAPPPPLTIDTEVPQ